MICAIHQPNFFPYYGFFKKIACSGIFIFLDDCQSPPMNKLAYLHRVGIISDAVEQWIEAPVKRNNNIKLKDVEFMAGSWKNEIAYKIEQSYKSSKFYDENIEFVLNMILQKENNLVKYNINSIIQFCLYLNIEKTFVRSSDKSVNARKTERLALLTKAFGCDTYLSGKGGLNYSNDTEYEKHGLKLIVNNYEVPKYEPNLSLGISSELSIIDMLFNIGKTELENQLKIN